MSLSRLSSVLLALIMSVSIFSCRKKDATVKLPKLDPKLNVICFISPQDTLLRVFVSQTQPLYNNSDANKFAPVTNAKVVISGKGLSVELSYNADLEEYTGDPALLNITEGITYEISVSTPDGKSARASTKVPASNTSLTYVYDRSSKEIRAKWADPLTEENNYRLMLQSTSYHIFEGYNQNGPFKDTIWTRNAAGYWAIDSDYNSPEIEYTITLSPYSSNNETMYLYLLQVSKEYYEYNKKLETSMNTGDPFQEPSIMYSNMNGGVGVFAGFNSYKLEVK